MPHDLAHAPLALLAAIKLPKEVALPLAIVGGVLFLALVLIATYRALGRKRAAMVGGAALIIGSVFGVRYLRAEQAERDARQAAREKAQRLGAMLNALPADNTFEKACSSAGPWNIEQLVLVYEARNSRVEQRHVTMSPSGDSLVGSDFDEFPRSPKIELALLAKGNRAAVVDLRSGQTLCGGTLPVSFNANYYGGFFSNVRAYIVALAPICQRLGDGFCGRVQIADQGRL